MDTKKLSKTVLVLRVMVLIVVAITVVEPVLAFINDEELFLEINDEIWRKNLSELSDADNLFLIMMILVPSAVWLYGLYQIHRLCGLYGDGEIFSVEAIRRFRTFAIALVIVALIESVSAPVLISYLWSREIIPDLPDISFFDYLTIAEIEALMVAVLFFAIARVMEGGAEMKRDAELTI